MNVKIARFSSSLGRFSLLLAALSTISAGAVVMIPGLVPAWASWALTLGGGIVAIIAAVASLGLSVLVPDDNFQVKI